MKEKISLSLNFKDLCQNLIIFYTLVLFLSYALIYILDLFYPVSEANIIFDDFYIVNLYFYLFSILFLFYINLKSRWLDVKILYEIEEGKLKKINLFLIIAIICGLFCFSLARFIYYFTFYPEIFLELINENKLECFFIEVKVLWSKKLSNYFVFDSTAIKVAKILHPIGILLLCLNFFYLIFLSIFSKSLKKSLIYSISISILSIAVFVLFSANKILLIYLVIILPALLPFKFISFKKFILIFMGALIICFSYIYLISFLRTSCILKKNLPSYTSKIEYDSREGIVYHKKKKSNLIIINNAREYLYNNYSKITSSLNWINYYAVTPKQTGEKLLEDYIFVDINNKKNEIAENHKFERLIILKEILNRIIYDFEKIGLNFKLLKIDKQFYNRDYPVSTFATLFLNFKFWSYVMVIYVFYLLYIFNFYLLKKTQNKIYFATLIFGSILFCFFTISIHGVSILATQNARYIFFNIFVLLIILTYLGNLKIKNEKMDK